MSVMNDWINFMVKLTKETSQIGQYKNSQGQKRAKNI